MSSSSLSKLYRTPIAGHVSFAIERLYCTIVTNDEADYRPVYGRAILAFDGLGAWWIEHLVVHSRMFGRADIRVAPDSDLGREVAARLLADRGDEVADAINDALGPRGEHMRIFGEALHVRRIRPPHVSVSLRGAVSSLSKATLAKAEPVMAAVAFALLIASVLAAGSVASMPWPGHQPPRHPVVLAALAQFDRVQP
jgi:hypothetical protein